MRNIATIYCAFMLFLAVTGCSFPVPVKSQQVTLSSCLYSSETLYKALVKHKGEVELAPDCDYLSAQTARQLAKLQ